MLQYMYAVVVGAGEVGQYIAEMLGREGHDVAVIDRDAERLQKIADEADALTIVGNGAARRVLLEANVGTAEMLMAVTDSDEVNMIACMVAKRAGVPLTVARIRNEDYIEPGRGVSSDFTGIDRVIQPEAAVAEQVGRLADYPGALEVESFANGQVSMVEVRVGRHSTVIGKKISEMGLPRGVLITGLLTRGEVTMPRGATALSEGDTVFIVGRPEPVKQTAALLSGHEREHRKAMVLGCGDIGLQIALELEERGLRPKVLEKDYDRAMEAASVLSHCLVLHDEGLSESFLLSEGVDEVGLFIAATGDDRLNMLAALQAKRLGAQRTIAVVETSDFTRVLQSMGVDVAVSPRQLTASAVLRYVRKGEVLSAALLDKSAGEVLELRVGPNSAVSRSPLREGHFPRGAVLAVLVRGEEVIMARGDSEPRPGDLAIVFSAEEAVTEVERMFRSK